MTCSTILHWIAASRPKTLIIAVAPVVMGCAMAWNEGAFHLLTAVFTLLAAVAIQIGTNFYNDYADFLKGADTPCRNGPERMSQSGKITIQTMRTAAFLSFGGACLFGLYLVWRGGPIILLIGCSSIAAGFLYTGGPRPLAYSGWGDPFVLLYFGAIAVAGTHLLQAQHWSWAAFIQGLSPGFLALAVLTINNLRDSQQDIQANKRTLVVRFGLSFGRIEYTLCWLFALAIPLFYVAQWPYLLLTQLLWIPGLQLCRKIWKKAPGPQYNAYLGITAAQGLLFSILFSLGYIL